MKDWIRWEFGRRIEATPGIRAITVERLVKATILLVGSVALVILDRRNGVQQAVLTLQSELNLDAGRSLWRQIVSSALQHFGDVPSRRIVELSVAGFLYGLLEGLEGVGLLLKRRWAEYLVLLATAVFIPVEVHELVTRPSVLKGVALLVNLLIMAYLVWRKRLFLERPSDMPGARRGAAA